MAGALKRLAQLALFLFGWMLGPIHSSILFASDASYPNRPIHIIVPYSPGSPTDIYARKIADVARRNIGAPIVIENKPGATGTLGATQIVRSTPDGYSLMITTSEPLIAGPALLKAVPYDPMRDFRFITKLYVSTPVLVVNASNGIRTLGQLIEQAKSRSITYGSFGPGSFHQISIEEFARQAGIVLREIPYRSPAQAAIAVLSNEVSLGYASQTQIVEQIKDGTIIPLAVVGSRRLPLLPEVPTFPEAGFNARTLQGAFWTGLVGPAGIPEHVVEKILGAFHGALRDPEIQRFFAQVGNPLVGNSPEQFDREIREEYARVVPLIRSINAAPD